MTEGQRKILGKKTETKIKQKDSKTESQKGGMTERRRDRETKKQRDKVERQQGTKKEAEILKNRKTERQLLPVRIYRKNFPIISYYLQQFQIFGSK